MLFELPALLAGWPPLWATAAGIILVSLMLAVVQIFSAPTFSLSGKHVIITGALGDVPSRVARQLFCGGAHLTLIAHAPVEQLRSLSAELSKQRQCHFQQLLYFSADLSDPIEASEVLHRAIHQHSGRAHALLCLEALSGEVGAAEAPLSLSSAPHGEKGVRMDRGMDRHPAAKAVLRIPPTAPLPSSLPPAGPPQQQLQQEHKPAAEPRGGSRGTPSGTPSASATPRSAAASAASGPRAAATPPPPPPAAVGLPALLVEQFGRLLRRRHYAAVHALATVAPYMQLQQGGGRVLLSTGWAQPLAVSPEPMLNALTLSLAGVLAAPLREQGVYVSAVTPCWQRDAERTAGTVVSTLRRYRFAASSSRLWGVAGGSVGNGIWGTPPTSFWALCAEVLCLGPARLTAAAALAHAKLARRGGAPPAGRRGSAHPHPSAMAAAAREQRPHLHPHHSWA